jgi:excinuclease ABC subunit A
VLNRLVDQGNTVIVIEHNLDVIKSADWIIDLGPEGGDRGGSIVAIGTPEEVAANAASYTGQVLAPLLGITPKPPKAKRAARPKPPATKRPPARRTKAPARAR